MLRLSSPRPVLRFSTSTLQMAHDVSAPSVPVGSALDAGGSSDGLEAFNQILGPHRYRVESGCLDPEGAYVRISLANGKYEYFLIADRREAGVCARCSESLAGKFLRAVTLQVRFDLKCGFCQKHISGGFSGMSTHLKDQHLSLINLKICNLCDLQRGKRSMSLMVHMIADH